MGLEDNLDTYVWLSSQISTQTARLKGISSFFYFILKLFVFFYYCSLVCKVFDFLFLDVYFVLIDTKKTSTTKKTTKAKKNKAQKKKKKAAQEEEKKNEKNWEEEELVSVYSNSKFDT